VTLTVALLGLGEAGRRFAGELVDAGVEVRGYDPDETDSGRIPGRRPDAKAAVADSDVVLSVSTAKAALAAAAAALPGLRPAAVYADLNTASPELKREVASLVQGAGARFADVALLGPVPDRGLGTPALASGTGAQAFADAFEPLGMPVEVISEQAGDAATLKLLRSVFTKGLAAAAIESLRAGKAAGHEDWLKRELETVIGRPLLERLLEGSRRHAERRVDEMEAARDLLLELGVEPRITAASAALLAGIAEDKVAGGGIAGG
jgi:3-hydroxyisobutyrate dehydrogenase-like beta-hydroxyacid dehydrogenase